MKALIALYEIDRDNRPKHKGNYTLKKEEDDNIQNIQEIHSMHTSSDDMYIAMTVAFSSKNANTDHLIATLTGNPRKVGKLELFIFNIAIVDAIRSAYKNPFEAIFEKGVHKGTILSLSVCPSKSQFVTICTDKTCKFWEYGNEFKEIFSYYFPETAPLCSSFHPLSIQCAVGFKESFEKKNKLKKMF